MTLVASAAYPVRLSARLDTPLSRWLWLVKWILAVPHYVVLCFLWVAAFGACLGAFVAILATGRYPRALFDFNLGVLRWTWRAEYYAYGALGTDRYPPFSLAGEPRYPAKLDVPYPERLSRGLVLVKWWLLAVPHYVIVAVLAGSRTSLGLIGILVLIMAVVRLFTGTYPQQLFDLVIGLDRWVFRVLAYAMLMTDVYPPFRLDMAGGES